MNSKVFLALGLFNCLGCSATSRADGGFEQKVDLVIAQIERQAPEVQADYFFKTPALIELYASSKANRESIEDYLLKSHPMDKKRVAVRLAQCLSAEDYLSLARKVSASNSADADRVVYEMINPGVDWGREIYRMHSRAEVIEIVSNELKRPRVSNTYSEAYAAYLKGDYQQIQELETIKFPGCN